MKRRKFHRLFAFLLALSLVLSFASCSNEEGSGEGETANAIAKETAEEKRSVVIYDNAAALGLRKFQDDRGERYNISFVSSLDEVKDKIKAGEADFASLPLSTAVELYEETGGKIKIILLNCDRAEKTEEFNKVKAAEKYVELSLSLAAAKANEGSEDDENVTSETTLQANENPDNTRVLEETQEVVLSSETTLQAEEATAETEVTALEAEEAASEAEETTAGAEETTSEASKTEEEGDITSSAEKEGLSEELTKALEGEETITGYNCIAASALLIEENHYDVDDFISFAKLSINFTSGANANANFLVTNGFVGSYEVFDAVLEEVDFLTKSGEKMQKELEENSEISAEMLYLG